jgi:hypothetical protein
MGNIFTIVKNILAFTVLTAVIASIGLFTDNPNVMVPAYGVGFLVILAGMYIYLFTKKKNTFEQIKPSKSLNIATGALLLIGSLVFPALAISALRGAWLINPMLIVMTTIVLLAFGFLGVILINVLGIKNKIIAGIGYLVLVLISTAPAILVTRIDASFEALGVVYSVLFVEAIIAWTGFSIFYNALKPEE